jgi:hypothetical protein
LPSLSYYCRDVRVHWCGAFRCWCGPTAGLTHSRFRYICFLSDIPTLLASILFLLHSFRSSTTRNDN